MFIVTELCSYFTAFLNNRQQPASDYFNQFFTPKELNNHEIIDGKIQLRATFLTENWIYHETVLKQKLLHFAMRY